MQTAIRTDQQESKQGYVRLKRVFAGREHGFAFAEDNEKIYSWGRCETGQCARAVDATTGAYLEKFAPLFLLTFFLLKGPNPSFGRATIKQTRLRSLVTGHDHTLLTYGKCRVSMSQSLVLIFSFAGESPGVTINYDTFIGEGNTAFSTQNPESDEWPAGSSGAFQFNGNCRCFVLLRHLFQRKSRPQPCVQLIHRIYLRPQTGASHS